MVLFKTHNVGIESILQTFIFKIKMYETWDLTININSANGNLETEGALADSIFTLPRQYDSVVLYD